MTNKEKIGLLLKAAQHCNDNKIDYTLTIYSSSDKNFNLSTICVGEGEVTTYVDWPYFVESINKILAMGNKDGSS